MLKKSILILLVLAAVVMPQTALAQSKDYFGFSKITELNLAKVDLLTVVLNFIRWALGFLTLAAIIMILYGGFVWMTSQGNPDKIDKAKAILKNTVIGLALILLSFAIVSLIVGWWTGGWSNQGGTTTPPGECDDCWYLGSGIIQSHYPARDQRNVPRNTVIVVTFKEEMDATTFISNPTTADGVTSGSLINQSDNLKIYLTGQKLAEAAGYDATVYTKDNRTFVFKTTQLLGTENEEVWITVRLGKNLKRITGEAAFSGTPGAYSWNFLTNGQLDLVPPKIVGIYPVPDDAADTVTGQTSAQAASGSIKVNGWPKVAQAAAASFGVLGTQIIGQSAAANQQLSDTISVTINDGATTANVQWNNHGSGFDNNSSMIAAVTSGYSGIPLKTDGSLKLILPDSLLVKGNDFVVNLMAASQGQRPTFKILATQPAYPVLDLIGANNYSGSDDVVIVTVNSGSQATVNWSNQSSQTKTSVAINNNTITLGLGLSLKLSSGTWQSGQQITVWVKSPVTADTLTITDKTWVFGQDILVGDNTSALVSNITKKIEQDLSNLVESKISGTSNATIILTAKVVGEIGNRIIVKTSADDTVLSTPVSGHLTGGADQKTNRTVNDTTDVPRNSIIQVQFSEPINPLSVSPSFMFVTSTPSGATDSQTVSGGWEQSNQYSVVEFTSDYQCGTNACGQAVYCLPAGRINTTVLAASLQTCSSASDCPGDYPTCSAIGNTEKKICLKAGAASETNCQTNKDCSATSGWCSAGKCTSYTAYPQASVTKIDGVVDLANNSLDANADGLTSGPRSQNGWPFYFFNQTSAYSKNPDTTKKSEDAKWSFYASAEIDLAGPIVEALDPTAGAQSVDINNSLNLKFGERLRSATLKPGKNYTLNYKICQGGTKFYQKCSSDSDCPQDSGGNAVCSNNDPFEYLFLIDSAKRAGYWITGENFSEKNSDDLYYDKTLVSVNHTVLSEATAYFGKAGSGVQDIQQNCFFACEGPGCLKGYDLNKQAGTFGTSYPYCALPQDCSNYPNCALPSGE